MTTDTTDLPPLPGHDDYIFGGTEYGFSPETMRAYARLAIQQERERCAQLCASVAWKAVDLADAIRAGR